MKYIKGLDTVRALAVFYVIIEHWGPRFQPHTIPGYIESIFLLKTAFGVNLFFVLSGFLITGILLNEKTKDNSLHPFLIIKNFFIRRSLRIFPIYYLFILICYLLDYPTVHSQLVYFLTYTANLLAYRTNLASEVSHTWTLSVEEQFYLIWPWIIIFINNKYLKHIFISIIVFGLISKYIAVNMYHHTYANLVFHWIDSFGIGALYAYIRLNEKKKEKFESAYKIVLPIIIYMAWMLSPFASVGVFRAFFHIADSAIALALIIFTINNKREWIRKYILENPFFNFIGKISYGIYLYHYTLGPSYDQFIYPYAKEHPSLPHIFTNYWFNYGVKLTLLIIVCWLSYIIIEQPILRLKKRFEYTSAA